MPFSFSKCPSRGCPARVVAALFLAGLFPLTACTSGRPRVIQTDSAYQASATAAMHESQAAFVFPEGGVPADADPVLQLLFRTAAQSSPRMDEQELNIVRADAFRFRGWRQHLPYITAGYSFGYFKLFRDSSAGIDEKLGGTYHIGLRYPIFAWGAIEAEKAAARLREAAAMQNAEMNWRHLVDHIRRDYYQAVILKNDIALKRRQLELEQRRQEATAALNKTGGISDNDTISRGVVLRQRRTELQDAMMRLENLVASIRILTGIDQFSPADLPADLPTPDVNPDLLESQLQAFSPSNPDALEARLARTQTELLDAEITQARARQLPIFNVGASMAQTPVQTSANAFEMQTIFFAGINGTWNIFDRDATTTTIRALRTNQRNVSNQLRANSLNRVQQLRALVTQIRSSRESLELRRAHLANARRTRESMRRQFELETVSKLDVENAEMNIAILERDIFADRVNLASAYYQFRTAIGQDPAITLYTPPRND